MSQLFIYLFCIILANPQREASSPLHDVSNGNNERVQTIIVDTSGYRKQGYIPLVGDALWLVDAQRSFLWGFSSRRPSGAEETGEFWNNQYIATKFRIPLLSEGDRVTFGANDVLDQVLFDFDCYGVKGGCASDGKLYICFGVKGSKLSPLRIRVYDTDSRCISYSYELDGSVRGEPKDLSIDGNYLCLNTHSGKVYRMNLPSGPSELSAKREMLTGVFNVKSFDYMSRPEIPAGFTPFYISAYNRHGARYVDDVETWEIIYGSLSEARRQNNLTPMGKALLERVNDLYPDMSHREGELTTVGYRQWNDAAGRITALYPEVFAGDRPRIRAESSTVMRVAMSMSSFLLGMKTVLPNADMDMYVSSTNMDHIFPYLKNSPRNTPYDQKIRSEKDGWWFPVYKEYVESRIDPSALMKRLFIDPSKTGVDPFAFGRHFYYYVADQNCLEHPVPCWDFMTEEETLCWAQADIVRIYLRNGRCDRTNFGRGWRLSGRILEYIIEKADEEMAEGGLRAIFGHDVNVMALLAFMKADDWGIENVDLDTAAVKWKGWLLPTASSLNFVFYRNEDGAVLMRPDLNGVAVNFPVPFVGDHFYEWNDFKNYYIPELKASEEFLKKTANAE